MINGANRNIVAGNLIGTDVTGAVSLSNEVGVQILSGSTLNRVGTDGGGSADSLEGNLISGNRRIGVEISGLGLPISENVVAGNLIGTDISGTLALANGRWGVSLTAAAQYNTIGTDGDGVADAAERNVISAHIETGLLIKGIDSDSNVVAGNLIGTDVTGTIAIGNGIGLLIDQGPRSNRVGTDSNGVADADERNLISGNLGIGVLVRGADNNQVAGNLVGSDISGTSDLGNAGDGVVISSGSTGNLVGGSTVAAGNLISGNRHGVTVISGSTNNRIQGNLIGTDVSGTTSVGNSEHGVFLHSAANTNVVGSDGDGVADALEGNLIAFNALNGVVVDSSVTGARIQRDSIHSNSGLGIDLGYDGVTLNDPGDGDSGANNLQNFPQLSLAASSGGSTAILGTLNSTPDTTFTVELFSSAVADPSGFGEGETFLGSTSVTTDPSGNSSFTATLPVSVAVGHFLTATATDLAGNTSEFSQAEAVAACSLTVINTNDGGPGSLRDAIDCSNTTPGADTIDFNIGGGGAQSIVLGTSNLPSITDPVIIDGSTQPEYTGTPLITIDAAAVTTSDVMRVWTGGDGTTLRDFNVTNAANFAILVGGGAGDNLITNVDASWGGSSATGTGFWITDSDNNTIRGVTATNRVQAVVLRDANNNLVENSNLSGSGVGVVLALVSGGNTIQTNNASGSGFGVRSSSSGSENRYLSNDFSQSTNYALDIFNESLFVVSGNDFSDSFAGVRLGNMDGLNLSPNPDFDIDVSTASLASYVGALALTNVTNSTISGFDLTSASAAAQGGAGLVVSGGSNNVIEDLTVIDRTWGVYANSGLTDTLVQRVDASWDAGSAAGTGFWITDSDNNTIRDVTTTNRVQAVVLRDANNNLIENSNLSGSGVGVVLALVSGGNTIQNNDASGSGFGVRSSSSGSGNQYLSNDFSKSTNYALDIFNESSFVVSGNDFSESFAGVRLGNMDGLILSPNPDFDIDVSTAGLANYVGALALTNLTNSTISGFDLTSTSAAAQEGIGLLISGGSNNVIENMAIVDRARGASLVSTSDNTIQCSTFSNNSIGILQSAVSGQVVINNDIFGNGIGVMNSSGDLIDAQNNYWGAADGPSSLGGSGDSFTGNVDAAPFRDGLPACLIDDLSAGGPYTVDEGNSIHLVASGIPGDPDSGTVQWDFDYDGITFDVDATGLEPLFDASNLDGPTIRTVGARAADSTGSTNIATTALRIDDVAPTLANVTATTTDENGVTTLTGTITDPGTLDTFTLDVDWGDPLSPNNTETYTFDTSATGSQTFTLTHRYLDDNPTATPQDNYAISATLSDDDGGALSLPGLNAGDIFVADFFGRRIVRVDPVTGAQTTVSSGGSLFRPNFLVIDGDGDLLVSDRDAFGGSGGIIRIDPVSGAQTTVSSGGGFVDPAGIALDANGDILLADFEGHSGSGTGTVYRVDPITGDQTTISTGGSLEDPFGIAVDANGDILVADFGNFESVAPGGTGSIFRIDPLTGSQTVISTGGNLIDPAGIVLDANGDILVADFQAFGGGCPVGCGGIIRVDPITGTQTTISTGGSFVNPIGIALDVSENIVVGDADAFGGGGGILQVDPVTGLQTTISSGGSFLNPAGLAIVTPPGTSDVTQTVLVKNVAPTLTLNPVATTDENGTATLTGTITDPGTLDTFTLDVNWGDPLSPNDTETYVFGASAIGSQTFALTHQYLDDPGGPVDNYTIGSTVTDDDGGVADAQTMVTVNNLVPAVAISGPAMAVVKQTLTFTLSAGDVAADEPAGFTYTIAWGDGSSDTIAVMPGNGSGVTVTHAYNSADSYTVLVTAEDKDSGTGSTTHAINVAEITSDGLQDVVDEIASGGGEPVVNLETSTETELDAAITAVEPLVIDPADAPLEIVLDLGGQKFTGKTVTVPKDVTLIIVNGTLEGASPALTVTAGGVVAIGVTFLNTTDAATVLVTAGSLTLRDSTINETSGGAQAAIEITGGVVDLGTTADPGGNTLLVYGAGDAIRNSSAAPVSALGNTFQTEDGTSVTTIVSPFRIEEEIFHALDSGGGGLVTYVADNVYVTLDEGSTAVFDLRKLVADAVTGASFTINSANQGSAVLQADGFTAEFTPSDNDSADFQYTATSGSLTIGPRTVNFAVDNVTPTLTLVGNQTIAHRTPFFLTDLGTIFDPGFRDTATGTDETFSFSIDWGDNTTFDTGTANVDVVGSPGVATTGSFDAGHAYVMPGSYTITVTVSDDDGGSDTGTFQIVVGRSIFVLNPKKSGTLSLKKDSAIDIAGSVFVNSSSKHAVSVKDHASVRAASIHVVGGVQLKKHGTITGDLSTGIAPIADPLAVLVAPGDAIGRGKVKCDKDDVLVLDPGVYQGIKASGHCQLILNSGTYILAGGEFKASKDASITGSEVFIYLAGSNFPEPGGHFKDLKLKTKGTLTLTPPTTGPYAGVLLFQARDNKKRISLDADLAGLQGTLYAPSVQLTLGKKTEIAMSLIVDRLKLDGGATSNLITDGSNPDPETGSPVIAEGHLLSDVVSVALLDPTGALNTELQARYHNAIATLSDAFAAYDLTLVDVGVENYDFADVRVEVATTSACGSASDGILGCTTTTGEITLLVGWDWYEGSDAASIDQDQFDFQSIVTHELGHSIGLDHSGDTNSVMYSILDSADLRRSVTTQDLTLLENDHDDHGGPAALRVSRSQNSPPLGGLGSACADSLSTTFEQVPAPSLLKWATDREQESDAKMLDPIMGLQAETLRDDLVDRVFSLRDQEGAGDIPEDLDLQLGNDAHLMVDMHTGSLRSVLDHPA